MSRIDKPRRNLNKRKLALVCAGLLVIVIILTWIHMDAIGWHVSSNAVVRVNGKILPTSRVYVSPDGKQLLVWPAGDESVPSYIVDVRNKTVAIVDGNLSWIDAHIPIPIDGNLPRQMMPYEAVDLPDPKLKLSKGLMSFTGVNPTFVGTCQITVSY